MRALVPVTLVLLCNGLVRGQGTPGANLSVAVTVTAVSKIGDTTAVTYVLHNDAASLERMFWFMVDAPAPVVLISQPEPQRAWIPSRAFGKRSVAVWGTLGPTMLPGQDSPSLTFSAFGLPGIDTTWVRGYVPPSEQIPPDSAPLPTVASVATLSVGVDSLPGDRSATNFLARLQGLLSKSCGSLSWVTSVQVCTNLSTALANATAAATQGDNATARTAVQDFLSQVEAQHGPGLPIGDNAYWLLKINAEFILTRLT